MINDLIEDKKWETHVNADPGKELKASLIHEITTDQEKTNCTHQKNLEDGNEGALKRNQYHGLKYTERPNESQR